MIIPTILTYIFMYLCIYLLVYYTYLLSFVWPRSENPRNFLQLRGSRTSVN